MPTTPAMRIIQSIVTQPPQAQYSLDEQLEELRQAAIALGLYDADDFLYGILRDRGRR